MTSLLSIPLRMKPILWEELDNGIAIFQFLWGWNLEEEPGVAVIKLVKLSIPLRMKRWKTVFPLKSFTVNFQFLWGWNFYLSCCWPYSRLQLSIPLRMKPDIRIVLQNNAIDSLSIPLRMKQFRYCRWKNQFCFSFNSFEDETTLPSSDSITNIMFCFSFNSFEDETLLSQSYVYIAIRVLLFFQFLWGWNFNWNCKNNSSESPFNSFEDETIYVMISPGIQQTFFQFLWGWNKSEIRLHSEYSFSVFQFLWGWNKQDLGQFFEKMGIELSIPLRMKHNQVSYIRRAGASVHTFNSFEDETKKGRAYYIYPDSIAFNSFEDETRSRKH